MSVQTSKYYSTVSLQSLLNQYVVAFYAPAKRIKLVSHLLKYPSKEKELNMLEELIALIEQQIVLENPHRALKLLVILKYKLEHFYQ